MRLTVFSVLLLILAACSDDNSATDPNTIPTNSEFWRRSDNIKVNTFAMKTVDACNGFALEGTDTVITDLIRVDANGRTYKLENIKNGAVNFTFIGTMTGNLLNVTPEYKSEFLPFDPSTVNLPLNTQFNLQESGDTMKLVAASNYDAGAGTMKTFNVTEQNYNRMSYFDTDIFIANAVACSYIKKAP